MHAELRWFVFHTLQRRSPQPGDRSRSSLKQMTRSHTEIVEDLNRFAPPCDDWDKLQMLLDELWRDGDPSAAIHQMLGVFERYPADEDGCGVFWSILHGLETLSGYEPHLMRSVQSSPSEFGVMMLGRIRNAKIDTIDSISILSVLQATLESQMACKRVREVASRFAAPR